MSAITESKVNKFKIKKSKIIEVPFWLWLVMLGVIAYCIGHFARELVLYFSK